MGTSETEFLALLRPLATHPAARNLSDDAAVLGDLVITHDMLVEGVHFLPGDPPQDVAWKLVAVNLSDLAAKGATPIGVLMGYALMGDRDWDAAFVEGLAAALAHFDVALLGGDTVASAGARTLSLTAIGRTAIAPSRSGAKAGDALYVTGVIGLAGLGLGLLQNDRFPEPVEGLPFSASQNRAALRQAQGSGVLHAAAINAYRRPAPRLTEGQALAPIVHAMMDVSDGLLIDAQRMAAASDLALEIDLDAVPVAGECMAAVTAGDDYELLFAAASDLALPVPATRIGRFAAGTGLTLTRNGEHMPLPTRLGWLHSQ